MRQLIALALLGGLLGAAQAQTSAPAEVASPAVPVAAPADAAPAAAPAAPAKAAVKNQPEADLSGLPIRPDPKKPDPAVSEIGSTYTFNPDGVNCTLYPARCR